MKRIVGESDVEVGKWKGRKEKEQRRIKEEQS